MGLITRLSPPIKWLATFQNDAATKAGNIGGKKTRFSKNLTYKKKTLKTLIIDLI